MSVRTQRPPGPVLVFTESARSVCRANELCKQDRVPGYTGEHHEGP